MRNVIIHLINIHINKRNLRFYKYESEYQTKKIYKGLCDGL